MKKDKQWSTNSTQKTKAWATQTLLKTGDELAMVFSVTIRLLVFGVMFRRSLFGMKDYAIFVTDALEMNTLYFLLWVIEGYPN